MERYLPPLSEKATRWLRFAGLVAALLLLAWVALDLRPVLTPIVVALAIAYILNPIISVLERRGVRRLYAVAGLYAVGTVLALAVGVYLIVTMIEQIVQLRESIDDYVQAARQWLEARSALATQPATTQSGGDSHIDWWSTIGPLVREHGMTLANSTLAVFTGVFSSALTWITLFVLIPMYTFFFLWKFNDIVRTIHDHLPTASRDLIVHLVTTIERATANFFRGRLIVCLIVGLTTGIGWTLVGIPYSLPLGALAGTLNLVPFMSLLALPPALVLSYLDAAQNDTNWVLPVLLAMGVYMAVQALESFVLTPCIEARSSGLHPITTVVALLIGATWAGLLGMLLAIPIASTLKVFAAEYVLPEIRRLAAASPAVADVGKPDDEHAATPAGPIQRADERADGAQDQNVKPAP